jgi:hypothetical protein
MFSRPAVFSQAITGTLHIELFDRPRSIDPQRRKNQKNENYEIFSSLISLGGSAKMISVSMNLEGRLEIFYIGTSGVIYHNRQYPQGPGGWIGETPL